MKTESDQVVFATAVSTIILENTREFCLHDRLLNIVSCCVVLLLLLMSVLCMLAFSVTKVLTCPGEKSIGVALAIILFYKYFTKS